MKRITITEAENLANLFRVKNGISLNEPVNVKTLLRKLGILTMYRQMSENSYGISCKSIDGKMFMLINSNSTRGRQHFTVCHEFYHLFYDKSPVPHLCGTAISDTERNADLFASVLRMPKEGILQMVDEKELLSGKIGLATILRIEQMFQVSRISLLRRLKEINLLTSKQFEVIQKIPVMESAREYGYDLSLYKPGNNGVTIGDFGEKARILFERGKISEGHYMELLNMISTDAD